MTVDRMLSITNLLILIGSAAFAGYEWITYKHPYEAQTLKQLEYSVRQIQIAVGADEQSPYDYEGELTVTRVDQFSDGTALYDITFDVTNTNRSKSPIRVSYSSAELYLGDPSKKTLTPGEAVVINDAPDPWHSDSRGDVAWKRVAYDAAIDDATMNPGVIKWMHEHYANISHVGLVGALQTGEESEYIPEFLVRARPSQYVAVVVSFGIDDTLDVTSPKVGIVDDVLLLSDADAGKSVAKVYPSRPHGKSKSSKLEKQKATN